MPEFQELITAQFNFADIYELFVKLFTHPNLENIMQHVWSFFANAAPVVIAAVFFALAVFFATLGRRLIGVPIVIGAVVFGYAGGVAFVAPRFNAFLSDLIAGFTIDPVIIGIALAVVFLILCLPLYYVAFSVGIGYSVYITVYHIFAISLGDVPATMIIAGGVALGVVAVALIFRRYSEMILTSAIGGGLTVMGIGYLVALPVPANIAIAVAVTALGSFIQIKTRRRF